METVTVQVTDLLQALDLPHDTPVDLAVGELYRRRPIEVMARIQPRRARNGRRYFVAVMHGCPFCGGRHVHSAGDDGFHGEGVRIPHCPPEMRPGGRALYRIAVEADSLPDPAELLSNGWPT